MGVRAFFLLLTLAVCNADVKLELSKNMVHGGDDVTIRCIVTNYEAGAFVIWKKRQVVDEVHQIGTNKLLLDQFKATGRYSVDVQEAMDQIIYLLNIKGATIADSGDIGCELSSPGGEDFKRLTVIVGVQNVTLYGMPKNVSHTLPSVTYEEDENVTFTEGDDHYFRCSATGSNPESNPKIYLDVDDITDHFTFESDEHLAKERGGGPGLYHIEHVSNLTTYQSVEILSDHNAKKLRCVASVQGAKDAETHINIRMNFKPRVSGCADHIEVRQNLLHYELACILKADPPVYPSSISWTFLRPTGINTTLRDGEEFSQVKMTVSKGKFADEYIAKLTFKRVAKAMFGSYFLYGESDLGNITYALKLLRDESFIPDGAAITSVFTPIIFITLASLSLF